MNFSFEITGAMLTGKVSPEMVATMWKSWINGIILWWRWIAYLAIITLFTISRAKIFIKAKLPRRWIFVPVYNRALMFQVGSMSWRWTRIKTITISLRLYIIFSLKPIHQGIDLLFLIWLLWTLALTIINSFKIAKNFWKHRTFGLGILFLDIIFIPRLAFDKSKRQGNKTNTTPITDTQRDILPKKQINNKKRIIQQVDRSSANKKTSTSKKMNSTTTKKTTTSTKKK